MAFAAARSSDYSSDCASLSLHSSTAYAAARSSDHSRRNPRRTARRIAHRFSSSMAIATVCAPPCSSNSASRRNACRLLWRRFARCNCRIARQIPHRYRLLTAIRAVCVPQPWSTAFSTVCTSQLSSNNASDRTSFPLVGVYRNALRAAIIVELLVVFHISCACRQLSHLLANPIARTMIIPDTGEG